VRAGAAGDFAVMSLMLISRSRTAPNSCSGLWNGPHSTRSEAAAAGIRLDKVAAVVLSSGDLLAIKCTPHPSREPNALTYGKDSLIAFATEAIVTASPPGSHCASIPSG
jgi:hypothetical protein